MQHQRGDVPGPTTKDGDRAEDSARPGQHAASAQASPPAPLGYGEEASENLGDRESVSAPVREKYYKPSEGDSPTRTDTPSRGGGYFTIPGEDS